jgi:hypothetical protein
LLLFLVLYDLFNILYQSFDLFEPLIERPHLSLPRWIDTLSNALLSNPHAFPVFIYLDRPLHPLIGLSNEIVDLLMSFLDLTP